MKVPEKYRIRNGLFGSDELNGNNGHFLIRWKGADLIVIASDGLGWYHVSVSHRRRTPTWEEMCFIKDLFFDPEETVIQFHPRQSEYVNNHPHCLHLWRKQEGMIELPPAILTGIKRAMEANL